jgi:DNA polymerase III delta prime subunit
MNKEQGTRNRLLHHAYLAKGNKDAVDILKQEIEAAGYTLTSANTVVIIADTFSIDQAKSVREMQTRQVVGGEKFFFLAFTRMLREAQNALLKTLEEPTAGTHLFLITPQPDRLLPTLRSRTEQLNLKRVGANTALAAAFVSAESGERLVMVKDLLERDDLDEILAWVGDLIALMHGQAIKSGFSIEHRKPLAALELASRYLPEPGSSKKLLLEYLALTLPVVYSGGKKV